MINENKSRQNQMNGWMDGPTAAATPMMILKHSGTNLNLSSPGAPQGMEEWQDILIND